MQQKKSIATNAVLNTLKTVLGVVFPLITFPYVSRILGVENVGIYTFSASFLSYFLLIAALGVATYGIREGVQYRDDRKAIGDFISELFTINMISAAIAYCLLFALVFSVPFLGIYRSVILILSAEVLFNTIGVSWVCNIFEDFFVIAVRSIAMQVVSLLLIFVFVRTPEDLNLYAAILLVSNSGANVFNYFYVKKKYANFHLTKRVNWKKHLRPIFIIFSTSIAITVYVSSDNLMLGVMTDNYQVGLYGTAVKVYTIIKNILAAILTVMIPRFTLLFSNNDEKQINSLFSNIFNILTSIMIPMCMGLFAMSDDIVRIVAGSAYAGAAQPLRLLSIAVCFSLYAFMYTQCILIPIKQEAIVFRATLISAVVNIGLNFFLIPIWGINAAAITTIIAELITYVFAAFYSRNTARLIGVRKNLITTFLGCICIFLICSFARRIDSLILRIGVSIAGSILAYIAVMLATQNPVFIQLKNIVHGERQ